MDIADKKYQNDQKSSSISRYTYNDIYNSEDDDKESMIYGGGNSLYNADSSDCEIVDQSIFD